MPICVITNKYFGWLTKFHEGCKIDVRIVYNWCMINVKFMVAMLKGWRIDAKSCINDG